VLQPKLIVGAANDEYEQEADRVAEQVMAAPTHPAVGGAPPSIQRYTGQATGETVSAPASVDRVLASPGQPLDAATRSFFEPRFGMDFSAVRVHTDAPAAESAQAINAHAYTVGRDVVFSGGQYAPQSAAGRRLLAHELTHVVQQQKGLSPASSHSSQPTQTHSQLDGEDARVAPTVQASPLPVTVHEAAKANEIYRTAMPNPDPEGGWSYLREQAQMLEDSFNTYEDPTSSFRNKGSARYRVTVTDDSQGNSQVINSKVYKYHSGKEGARNFLGQLLMDDTSLSSIGPYIPIFGNEDFGSGLAKTLSTPPGSENDSNLHNEAVMKSFGAALTGKIRANKGETIKVLFEGYTYSFYESCDECRGRMGSEGQNTDFQQV
jgi:hypothetical protein